MEEQSKQNLEELLSFKYMVPPGVKKILLYEMNILKLGLLLTLNHDGLFTLYVYPSVLS